MVEDETWHCVLQLNTTLVSFGRKYFFDQNVPFLLECMFRRNYWFYGGHFEIDHNDQILEKSSIAQLASWRWPNVGTTSVLPLAWRCQVTLARRNFVHRPNIGTTVAKRRWHGVGKPPLDWRHFFQFARHWHNNIMQISSLKCYTTFKAKLTTFGQAPIYW